MLFSIALQPTDLSCYLEDMLVLLFLQRVSQDVDALPAKEKKPTLIRKISKPVKL